MQVPIDGCHLQCCVAGEGPPLLFIHGFPLSSEMWRPVIRLLSHDWLCVAPDLRGHGRSDVTEDVTIGRFADDLARLADGFGQHRPVVVIGLSMGGVIAFDFYRRYRSLVRALVLVDTRANAESPEGVARREALAQTALRDGSRAVADQMIDGLFAPATPPELKAVWRERMARTPPTGLAAAARALARREESFSTLPTIDCPTLVVVGEQDTLTPVAALREIHEGISGSRFEIIPEAGHLPPVEQPEAFARVLRQFLERLV